MSSNLTMRSNKILQYVDKQSELALPRKEEIFQHLLYDKWDYLFIVLRILGLFPIKQENSGEFVAWKLCISTIISVIILSSWTIVLGISSYFVFFALQGKTIEYNDYIPTYGIYVTNVVMVLPWVFFFEGKKVAGMLDKFNKVRNSINRATRERILRPNLKKQHKIIILLACALMASYGYVAYGYFVELQKRYDLSIPPVIREVIQFKTIYFAFIFLSTTLLWRALNMTLVHCTDHLASDIETFHWVTTRTLSKHFIAWKQLADLHEEIGNAMGYSLATMCLLMYSHAVAAVYIATKFSTEADLIVLTLIIFAFISHFLETGSMSAAKIDKGFQSRLTAILDNEKVVGLEHLIHQFQRGITDFNLEMSLCGLFKVDRSVNLKMYSNILAYYIIILQLKGEDDSGKEEPTSLTSE